MFGSLATRENGASIFSISSLMVRLSNNKQTMALKAKDSAGVPRDSVVASDVLNITITHRFIILNEEPRLKNVVSYRPKRPSSTKPKGPC